MRAGQPPERRPRQPSAPAGSRRQRPAPLCPGAGRLPEDISGSAVQLVFLHRARRRRRRPVDLLSAWQVARRLELDQWTSDRKSVVKGKSVSVRVDLGGGRTIKKKNRG